MANIITTLFASGFRLVRGEDLNQRFALINNAFSGATAFAIGQATASGLTAVGTTRANALALTSAVNVIGTAAASTGVVLPSAATVGIGGVVRIYNDGANPIKVYSAGSDTIDGVAGTTGVTLTNALRCDFQVTAALTFKSAKLGTTST